MRRAGLDYHQYAELKTWRNWAGFTAGNPGRVLSFSTRNHRSYADFRYQAGDILLFGSETRGLPDDVFFSVEEPHRLHIPMLKVSRSLNLSNSVAIAVYEAWRQLGFRR